MREFRWVLVAALFAIVNFAQGNDKNKGYYYQLKIYHLDSKIEEERMDRFLRDAYLPALRKAGIEHIGVFKPIAGDSSEQLIYVFIPSRSLERLLSLDQVLTSDKEYLKNGTDYIDAPHNDPPYARIESILLKAFKGMPAPALPQLSSPKRERVYELRSYESATEKIAQNKIDMFNEGEIDIFTKLNFNAVFYGKVISGSHMPNLMYLTTFNNQADRDSHWSAFGPLYKPLSELPEHKDTQTKNFKYFLYPTDYSDY